GGPWCEIGGQLRRKDKFACFAGSSDPVANAMRAQIVAVVVVAGVIGPVIPLEARWRDIDFRKGDVGGIAAIVVPAREVWRVVAVAVVAVRTVEGRLCGCRKGCNSQSPHGDGAQKFQPGQ